MTPRQHPARYHCVVASEFAREQIDPRIKAIFEERGQKPKFGDLRKIWRKRHCATLNPYGFEDCPYEPTDCALAYLSCITNAVTVAERNPMGYFWQTSKSLALTRADDKPLLRDRHAQGPRHAGAPAGSPPAGSAGVVGQVSPVPGAPGGDADHPGLRRRLSRPDHIGTLLGQLDLGPREGRAPNGEAGGE